MRFTLFSLLFCLFCSTAFAQNSDSTRIFKATVGFGLGYFQPISKNLVSAISFDWEVHLRLRNAYSFTVRGLANREYTDSRYAERVFHRYTYTALLVGRAIPLPYKRGADLNLSIGPAWVRYRGVENVELRRKTGSYIGWVWYVPASDYYAYDRVKQNVPGLALSASVQAPWGRFVGNRLGIVACFSSALSTVHLTWGITFGKAR
ncbi:MAG: hypothetical protein LH606_15220 [Cytophagaceae bacterium]|nr:hypothetical protein [Cytophagaceae bacterium]